MNTPAARYRIVVLQTLRESFKFRETEMLLEDYQHTQGIAKKVHSQLGSFITSGSTERSIAMKAAELLAAYGAPDTWYHDVPAFVLLGSRSCLSISGRDYIPVNEPVGDVNLVTVDLSPKVGKVWGDCARSYVVEEGAVTNTPEHPEFVEGLAIQQKLHKEMIDFAKPDIRFSDLFEYGNDRIRHYGYENLDFLKNLGHSIEIEPSKRRFINNSCHERLGDVGFFTFEPHIRRVGRKWGFKHENIYYFDERGHVISL